MEWGLFGDEAWSSQNDVAIERLRCAEGADRSDCAFGTGLSLRDIADPRDCGLRHPEGHGWELNDDCGDLFFDERPGNVYENKGFGKKVRGLAQTLLLNVCDAPKAQVGQIVRLALTCPFGTSQTPEIGVCASHQPRP